MNVMNNTTELNDPFGFNNKIRLKFGKDRYDPQKAPFLSRFIWRKFSLPVTYFVAKTSTSANQLTIMGFILGIIAGLCFFKGESYYITGVWSLVLYSVLDNVDGEIARLKNQVSSKGFLYDHYAGTIIDFSLIFGLSVGYYRNTESISVILWGFLIFGFWTISSDILTNLKLEMVRSSIHGSKRQIVSLSDVLIKQNKNTERFKKIYSLIFSGTSRTIFIIMFMLINSSVIIFYLLSVLAVGELLVGLYIFSKTTI